MAADIPGSLYLLCFPGGLHVTGNRYASHYLGWTEREIEARVSEHLRGQGSPMVRAAVNAGFNVEIVRTWENVTRNQERRVKDSKNLARYCPRCVAKTGRNLADIPPTSVCATDDISF